ncbi:long-chain-fatty-acyl-CoA reductase [Leptospira fluminis]|uniref:Acyl-CoA reductase n=1 Tax=Leptospira fluminis TaxID=2484979 RepID=A0A4R9GN82_9LEPT|nr:acyl-CoA reductase [Leptospira fluminis]TGK15682.1 long-chain-fatty-acyl-CoA reductase [Leptospira fluminis]
MSSQVLEEISSEKAAKGKKLSLPFILNGKAIKPEEDSELRVEVPGGTVVFPSRTQFETNFDSSKGELERTPTQEIIGFLHRVGRMWENDEYVRRRIFIRQIREFAGYSEQMAVAEADLIAATLRGSTRLWDTLQIELGDRFVLDSWIRKEDCEVRAFPKGLVVHILAGNAPIAGVLSILRSILTKNRTLAKTASGDPITATQLGLSFLDLDPNHPVSRSFQTVYWPSDSTFGASILQKADTVCVWGGNEALAWTHRNTPPGIEIVSFGPKQSFCVVKTDGIDLGTAARLVAHDISMYDQQACFSTQNVFVLGDHLSFAKALSTELERYDRVLSPPERSMDQRAGVVLSRVHHEFLGATVSFGNSDSWQVIVSEPRNNLRHPGCRTAFVFKIASPDQLLPMIDSSIQTIAVYPSGILDNERDEIGRSGISRIVEAGSSGIYRLGATHDGMYPMTRFVRFVSTEFPSSFHPKGMTIPLDMSKIIEHRQFRDLFV